MDANTLDLDFYDSFWIEHLAGRLRFGYLLPNDWGGAIVDRQICRASTAQNNDKIRASDTGKSKIIEGINEAETCLIRGIAVCLGFKLMSPAAFDEALGPSQQAAFKLLVCGSAPQALTEMNEGKALEKAGAPPAPSISEPLSKRVNYYAEALEIIENRAYWGDDLLMMQGKLGARTRAIGERVAREALKVTECGTEQYAENLAGRTLPSLATVKGRGPLVGSITKFIGGRAGSRLFHG